MIRNNLKHFLGLMLFALVAECSFAQFILTDKPATDPAVLTGKLPNGLTYYIKKNTKPEKKVELRLVVNTGSVLEEADQQGLAHFMEHMSFNGSTHFKKNELVNYLQSIGVKFGADLNAYTSFDETVYILPVPSDDPGKVEKAFTILEDWAGNATLDTTEINKERGIVLEEASLRKSANERMGKQYYPELFNGSPYASRLPIGKEDILQNFKAETLTRFYKTWYRPNLQAVIVVGDMDPQAALAQIKKHFSHFTNPAAETARPSIIPMAERKADMGMVVTDKEQTLKLLQVNNLLVKTTPITTWGEYRETIVENLFNTLINQRLSELAQQPDPPFLFGSAGFGPFMRGYRVFSLGAALNDKPVSVAMEALVATTESVRQFGFLTTELERGKTTLLTQSEKAFNDKDKTVSATLVQEYINNYLTGAPMPGIANRYAFLKQILPGISLNEVNAVAKRTASAQGKFALLLAPEKNRAELPDNTGLMNAVTAAYRIPVKAYGESTVASSLMSQKPSPGKITAQKKNSALGTTDLTFRNGITVTLRPTDFKNDEIKMDAWRWGGHRKYSLADKQNAENATNIIQQMGVKDLTPVDLRKFLAGKPLRVQPYMNEYDEGIEGNSRVNDLETMLQLVNLYFTSPRSDEKLFTTYINTQKGFLKNLMDNPGNYFMDTLTKFQFNNHPWATMFAKPADFDKISLARVNAIYKGVFNNAYGMHFTFVGNIDPEKIKPLLATYLGSLPGTPKEVSFKDEGMRPAKGVLNFTINKGAAKQSMVSFTFTGEAPFTNEEQLKLQALNETINIKINEKLREELSLIYGGAMFGAIVNRPYNHYTISARLPTAPENIEKVADAFLAIIRSAREMGVTQKDLDKVKKNLLLQNEEALKDNEHWLNILSTSFIEKTDPMWIKGYKKKVQGLTVKDMQQAAQKYLRTDNYILAVLNPE
ncbi:MAG: insulinase family protein [Ferruginibacter sp.]